jgi:ketosteroid isomerase-like protein
LIKYLIDSINLKLNEMKIAGSIIHILLIGGFCCSCRVSDDQNKSKDKEKELIEKTISAAIGWAGRKDITLLYSVIANDSAFLEVHPEGSVVKGFSEFKKAEKTWMSPDFQAVRYEIRDLKINISMSGDVAWWFCILDDINTWKGEPASWMNTRWTGVAEKRKGKWVIVQQHFSFASE